MGKNKKPVLRKCDGCVHYYPKGELCKITNVIPLDNMGFLPRFLPQDDCRYAFSVGEIPAVDNSNIVSILQRQALFYRGSLGVDELNMSGLNQNVRYDRIMRILNS